MAWDLAPSGLANDKIVGAVRYYRYEFELKTEGLKITKGFFDNSNLFFIFTTF